jgi:hypothetical protein
LRPSLLRLADEDDIGQVGEVVLLDRGPGASDHEERPAPLQLGQDLSHPAALDDHTGNADDVGTGTTVVIDLLDVLVEQRDGMAGRGQGGQQGQAGDRHVSPLAHQRQGVLQAPVRDLEVGIDQDDFGHGPADLRGKVHRTGSESRNDSRPGHDPQRGHRVAIPRDQSLRQVEDYGVAAVKLR